MCFNDNLQKTKSREQCKVAFKRLLKKSVIAIYVFFDLSLGHLFVVLPCIHYMFRILFK